MNALVIREVRPPANVESLDQALCMVEAAYSALVNATEFSQVRQCRNMAIAAAAYAKEAKDSRLIAQATELRTRAERKSGEMLVESAKNGQRMVPSKSRLGRDAIDANDCIPPTLKQIGVTADQSSQWQKLAKLTDKQFEKAVETTKAVVGEVTASRVLKSTQAPAKRVERDVVQDDSVDPPLPAPTLSHDQQAMILYESIRQLSQITISARQLHAALPQYQHFRIANAINTAVKLLKEIQKIWTS